MLYIPLCAVFILPLAQNATATFSQILFSLGIEHLSEITIDMFKPRPHKRHTYHNIKDFH